MFLRRLFEANGLGFFSHPYSRFPLYPSRSKNEPGCRSNRGYRKNHSIFVNLVKIFANLAVKLYFYLLNNTI